MPQGDLKELDFKNPLNIKAYQYDIVCNGVELSSGAIRNHIPELMYKLFAVAGYSEKDVTKNLWNDKCIKLWSSTSWRYSTWYR